MLFRRDRQGTAVIVPIFVVVSFFASLLLVPIEALAFEDDRYIGTGEQDGPYIDTEEQDNQNLRYEDERRATPGRDEEGGDSETSTYPLHSLPPVPPFKTGERIVMIPPPQGLYLGQTEISPGNVRDFERAIGRKVAIFASLNLIDGQEEAGESLLTFDVTKANQLWRAGYVFYVGAYEAYPGHGTFTVDKLLSGKYDSILHRLAAQFKQFGHPMIFQTAREPNGVLVDYMGGWGPNGDQRAREAHSNWNLNQFDPSKFHVPGNPTLLNGLGDPQVCDGLERLVAAQRYYYDFFVRREEINFLTFDSMGWAAGYPKSLLTEEPEAEIPTCGDLSLFLQLLDGYYDWVTINWYMVTEGGREAPLQDHLDTLEELMRQVRKGAPGKPVLFPELGVNCGNNRPGKIRAAFSKFLTQYPEIQAFTHWGGAPPTSHPCDTKPGTPGASALKQFMDRNPSYFHSCVMFSDGSKPPGCQ